MRARVLCRFEEARADLQCDVYPCTWHVQTCRAICWLAYGRDECELEVDCWPEHIGRRTFDDMFPAGVETAVAYHGGEWRYHGSEWRFGSR